MKNSYKAWVTFRRILFILFLFFLINFFQAESNNNNLSEKTILTEEKIKEFEEDVKNGEYVDVKNYTEETYIETSNNISNFGYSAGITIADFFGVKLIDFFKFLGSFIS